jgi:hypothetical protein
MQVYEFHSRRWPMRALARDPAGSGLPAAYAPWDAQNDGEARIELDTEDVLYPVLERNGFFLTTVKARTTRTESV